MSSINYLKRILRSFRKEKRNPLEGDRAIEWSWVVENLPNTPSKILDFGCVGSVLTCISSRLGHTVTAIDLREIEYEMNDVKFIKQDFLTLDFGNDTFDIILNSSTIEHVGLPNRYGATEVKDGDIIAMGKLAGLLKENGKMILTIPVGIDDIYTPLHRIYGMERLPLLLKSYRIIKEEFWFKNNAFKWVKCSKKTALNIKGSYNSYALGLFLLEKKL